MIRHTESVARVTASRTVGGESYDTIEVDYVTPGGVTKTLVLAHGDADVLRNFLIGEIESMEPERRRQSFIASLRRKR